MNEIAPNGRGLLRLATPPAAGELGDYLLPDQLYCENAEAYYRPIGYVVAAPGRIQTHCPLCDLDKRTSADKGYNERRPYVHTHKLSRRPTLANLEKTMGRAFDKINHRIARLGRRQATPSA